MDTSSALVTAAVVVASSEAKRIKNKQAPTIKPVLGGFMLGFFLLALGSANDHIANLFAILIVITAILTNGLPIISKK